MSDNTEPDYVLIDGEKVTVNVLQEDGAVVKHSLVYNKFIIFGPEGWEELQNTKATP